LTSPANTVVLGLNPIIGLSHDSVDVSYYGQNDDEGKEVHRHGQAAAKSPPSPAAGGSDERFDLCGSMCGSAWAAWAGTSSGIESCGASPSRYPSLCYHEESDLDSIANCRKPRASLDLSRVETIAEMHSKQKPGLPSQDLPDDQQIRQRRPHREGDG
jgi:hypothetical protein